MWLWLLCVAVLSSPPMHVSWWVPLFSTCPIDVCGTSLLMTAMMFSLHPTTGNTWNITESEYRKYSKNLWTFWLFNSPFLKFRRKHALFCSCLAKIRAFCKISGVLCRHFLKCSVNKIAATGSFLFTVSALFADITTTKRCGAPMTTSLKATLLR